MVQIGEELEVRVLRVDTADRKIGLSCRSDEEIRAEAAAAEASGGGTAGGGGSAEGDPRVREELKGGMGAGAGPLFSLGADGEDEEAPAAEAPAAEAAATEPAEASEEASEVAPEAEEDSKEE